LQAHDAVTLLPYVAFSRRIRMPATALWQLASGRTPLMFQNTRQRK